LPVRLLGKPRAKDRRAGSLAARSGRMP